MDKPFENTWFRQQVQGIKRSQSRLVVVGLWGVVLVFVLLTWLVDTRQFDLIKLSLTDNNKGELLPLIEEVYRQNDLTLLAELTQTLPYPIPNYIVRFLYPELGLMDSLAALNQQLSLQPTATPLLIQKIHLLRELGYNQQAQITAIKVLELDPNNEQLRRTLSEITQSMFQE